ncbi:MAG: rod shape-determining protein MreC [Oscillospiraceae bacterium]|nr:rod shape-determining protein MreC [Oscillospiraceae bacterium]
MRHYFTNKIRMVLLIALLLAVGLGVVSSLTDMNLPQNLVQSVLTPFRTGISKLVDRSQQLYNYIFEYESLLAENEALKAQLAEIEDEARDAYATKQENERLRAALKLIEANEDYKLVDAYIISTSSADWSSVFTINQGTNVGIQPGMCAITAYGELVGLVSEVGTNYAVVKSVLDSSLEISATIAASGHSGMVQGGYASGLEGLLRMNYLPSSATIRNNDQVVTTGSTVYPRNLILGHVVDAGFDGAGVAKYALLKPAADIRSLEQVFIMTDYNAG